MSNSSMVSINSPCKWNSPRTGKISKITPHHMAGAVDQKRLSSMWETDSINKPSANYAINGKTVSLHVDESRRSHASSSAANDGIAVTIEVANDGGAPEWHVSDESFDTLIQLCVDICQRNGMLGLNYTGDSSGTLTYHSMFANTACPGPYLKSKFPELATEVNKRLGNPDYTPTLRRGDSGAYVKELQTLLGVTADGDFGPATEAAVKAYQASQGLDADGIAGPATWEALKKGENDLTREETIKLFKELQPPVYETLEDVPAWGREAVEEAIKDGILQGEGGGKLNLSHDFLRTLVFFKRKTGNN